MKPVVFACETTLDLAPAEVAGKILDVANWTDFRGYGPLPGVKSAEFEVRTPEVVGSRIRVVNTDASRHVEEITEWEPGRRVVLRMAGFSPPLSHLATCFEEAWEFEAVGDRTRVVRNFTLHPKSGLARPLLVLISVLLRRAVARHLGQMDGRNGSDGYSSSNAGP
jgi:hypothetical protein